MLIEGRSAGLDNDSLHVLDSTQAMSNLAGRTDAQHWVSLVNGVKVGETSACCELYRIITRISRRTFGYREYFNATDRVHDAYVEIVESIRGQKVREPNRIAGFIKTVVHRKYCGWVETRVTDKKRLVSLDDYQASRPTDALNRLHDEDRRRAIQRCLAKLKPHQREILVRFYLEEQSEYQIRKEMRLSDTQFRNAKWRAKAKFGRMLNRTPLLAVRMTVA